MNCNDANEALERMMFEEVQIDSALTDHLGNCLSCNQVYKDTMKSKEVFELIRLSEPMLSDPVGFTDSILSALPPEKRKPTVVPLFFKQMLAASSVALFLLFGYEQYGVVSKVSALEKQFSVIREDSGNSNPWRLTSTIDINKAGISFSEMEKLFSGAKGNTSRFNLYSQKRLHIKTSPVGGE
jgi:hypothetical protein